MAVFDCSWIYPAIRVVTVVSVWARLGVVGIVGVIISIYALESGARLKIHAPAARARRRIAVKELVGDPSAAIPGIVASGRIFHRRNRVVFVWKRAAAGRYRPGLIAGKTV